MSQTGTPRRSAGGVDGGLLVTGIVTVVASVVAAAWMLRTGDVVTAIGLLLLVAAGVLLSGIGLSTESTP
ncbi:MAG: hypothetical protein ABEK02_09830 [Haloquadratum sp.]